MQPFHHARARFKLLPRMFADSLVVCEEEGVYAFTDAPKLVEPLRPLQCPIWVPEDYEKYADYGFGTFGTAAEPLAAGRIFVS